MSSASTDKLACVGGSGMDGNTCLELALEGERLCKAGDCRAGVAYFEAAISAGTDDLRTLSAIYSQLGNAYFYLGDYVKAMQYHKHDLTLARTMGDKLGEAKASGNLGNTLKVMGKFDEAMICCKRHLEISQDLNDKVGEGRALYNLGNVYHAKGKHIGRLGQQDPGEFPEEVRSCLQQAVYYYEENLRLMRELGDTAAQGRACGNLGNTHYLLGNFTQSISYHNERLKIAREFGDKAAERRAHSNLGNAHIFLGEFEVAADHYKRTLVLAQDLGDRAVEAQACYSLGNTYTLLRDYPTAVDYHLRHLRIAQELMDRVGEGRACWSLGNAHSAMGNHEKALYFATKHLEISKEIGDQMGQATAQMNVGDLRKVLGLPPGGSLDCVSPDDDNQDARSRVENLSQEGVLPISSSSPDWRNRVRRKSMEQLDLIKLTPDGKQRSSASSLQTASAGHSPLPSPSAGTTESKAGASHLDDEESFFDLLSRFQSKRMDDQRCSLTVADSNKENQVHLAQSTAHVKNNFALSNNNNVSNHSSSSEKVPVLNNSTVHKSALSNSNGNNKAPVLTNNDLSVGTGNNGAEGGNKLQEELLDLIAGMQSKRMDEQRVALPHLPGLHPPSGNASPHNHPALQRLSMPSNSLPHNPTDGPTTVPPDDSFFEMLMRCQGTRLEDQRSSLPPNGDEPTPAAAPSRGPTVPDEDFFSLIMRLQSGRMEDQRAAVPLPQNSAVKKEETRFKVSSASSHSSHHGRGNNNGKGSHNRKDPKK